MKSTNLDLLLEEHNLGEQIGEKYFSYMYSIIQFTFVYYGGLITVLSSKFRVIETYRETIVYIIFMCILIKAMLNIEKLYKTELDKINAEYMYPEETK